MLNYDYNKKPEIKILTPEIEDIILTSPTSVLCGRNNSGKSFLLRKIYTRLGDQAVYVGPSRYQNLTIIGAINPNNTPNKENFINFTHKLRDPQANTDETSTHLNQSIANLDDDSKDTLFDILEKMLQLHMEIKTIDPNNKTSQNYIDVDGFNFSYSSSGVRLLTSIVSALLDKNCKYFLIDEPELGISPETQEILAKFLFDTKNRTKYFPHMEKLILATHSHIFLDRENIKNNYFIKKESDTVTIEKINTIQEINSLQFFLLGNKFETLFLPSAIVLVEGPTDLAFIKHILIKKFPNNTISIIQCLGDDFNTKVNILKNTFGKIERSPYHDRIFIITDQKNSIKKEKLINSGIIPDNIIVLTQNGIEYYYPKEIIKKIVQNSNFTMDVTENGVQIDKINYKKQELSDQIIPEITGSEELDPELNDIIEKIKNKI